MKESDWDHIAKAFSELTMLLEDAAALAVDGQSRKQAHDDVRSVSEKLRLLLNASVTKLDRIDRRIDDCSTS